MSKRKYGLEKILYLNFFLHSNLKVNHKIPQFENIEIYF